MEKFLIARGGAEPRGGEVGGVGIHLPPWERQSEDTGRKTR